MLLSLSADRRQQLLRIGCGGGYQLVRVQLGRGVGHRCRCFDRSSRNALSVVKIVNATQSWYEAGGAVRDRVAAQKAQV